MSGNSIEELEADIKLVSEHYSPQIVQYLNFMLLDKDNLYEMKPPNPDARLREPLSAYYYTEESY